MPDSNEETKPLSPIFSRLSSGDVAGALDLADNLLSNPPVGYTAKNADVSGLIGSAALLAVTEEATIGGILARYYIRLNSEQLNTLAQVSSLVQLAEAASPAPKNDGFAVRLSVQALDLLEPLAQRLVSSGSGNGVAMRADQWFDGVNVAALSSRLARIFHATNQLPIELGATMLAAKMTTQFQSAYPDCVIPMMNAVADCLRRMNQRAEAALYYAAILGDFLDLIEDFADYQEHEEVDGDDTFILEELAQSCRGYLDCNEGEDTFDCEKNLATIQTILARSS